jgi:diketogulonate reductase-like aldo/keto reductase
MHEMAAPVPTFLYGTAWKEEATARLVRTALDAGFTAIDTANQRKHYNEAGVGAAIAAAGVPRAALFLQTKFTSLDGQDHRLPYDRRADVATQVEQSFASSLEHLGTRYLDSLVLHGPSMRVGLADEDWQAWHAMEAIAGRGGARMLGASNIDLGQLQLLLEHAEVPPRIVQNRCYARRRWDRDVRALCRAHGIQYQPFSLLTANPEVLGHAEVARIAARLACTPAQVVFAFALAIGAAPLTGTTSAAHMREDLAARGLVLEAAEIERMERLDRP